MMAFWASDAGWDFGVVEGIIIAFFMVVAIPLMLISWLAPNRRRWV